MSSSAASDVQSDVLIKLTIGEDDTQDNFVTDTIRRISIGRLLNVNSELSFLELAKFCVLYSPYAPSLQERKESKKLNLDDWKIVTTYIDSDGDLITFSSNVEFAEAIDQLRAGERILRVRANVTRKGESPSTPREKYNVHTIDHAKVRGWGRSVTDSKCASPRWGRSVNDTKCASSGWGTRTASDAKCASSGWGRSASDTQCGASVSGRSVDNTDCATSAVGKSHIHTDMRAVSENGHGSEQKGTAASPEKKEPDEIDPDFIHKRHTCDSCCISPIVGIRYHAQNIPDYDLCQDCMAKCQVKDIVFQPEQLRRDMRFQYRRKRHERMGRQPRCRRAKIARHIAMSNREEGTKETKDTGEGNEKRVDDFADVLGLVLSHFSDAIGIVANEVADTTTEVKVKNTKTCTTQDIQMKQMNDKNVKDETGDENPVKPCSCNETTKEIESPDDVLKKLTVLDEVQNMKTDDELKNEASDGEKLDTSAKSDDINRHDSASRNEDDLVPETAVEHSVQSSKNVLTDNLGFCDEQTSTECVIVGSIPDKDDPTRKTCDDSSKSSEEWSVVGDENIVANATRMIGSALFEEDMTRSQENASFPKQESMVGGPSSSVGSLSSSIPTISSKNTSTSSVVFSKWENDIIKLRELGFGDDEKSIDALETLNAAKIGIGDYVAVTIDEAVDQILKQAEK
eukprot:CAMPEP_0194393166 /NCGR_PEP_ID=MMETSP0174-20130528/123145_1 /TAXON_ID=216777 /ORGANISM="Proboscia alata, Strain PI-D3" /LENGTH=684 /DNA_ID=CAMNT_0039188821 /DNA_START=46 /DNA_END=2100 /DNA_ORIENTATION=+